MKTLFSVVFAVLALLSALAWKMQPQTEHKGKTPLVWVSDDNPARREQISLFNRLNPAFDLRLDPNNSGLEKIIVQSIGGVGPDLFDCYDAAQLSAYVKSGIAWDVTDALKREGIDPEASAWKVGLPAIRYEGRYYGLNTNAGADGIWINKTLFDQAGIPYPQGAWKWEDLIELAKKLTVRDEKGRAKQFGFICDWGNWPLLVRQFGGRIFTEDGTRCILDSPEAVAGVQLFHDLIYKYGVMPSPVEEAAMATAGGWGTGTITQFGASKAAMALGGRWWLCTLRGYDGLKLAAVEAPHAKNRLFRGYGRATLVNRNSPRKEQALKFLLYLAKKDYNELINEQADALSPMIEHCKTPLYLNNPKYPEENYNTIWRDITYVSEPSEISPFINNQLAQRIYNKQLDLIKNDQKPVADALRTAAQEINAEIQKTLERDPELKSRYATLTQGNKTR